MTLFLSLLTQSYNEVSKRYPASCFLLRHSQGTYRIWYISASSYSNNLEWWDKWSHRMLWIIRVMMIRVIRVRLGWSEHRVKYTCTWYVHTYYTWSYSESPPLFLERSQLQLEVDLRLNSNNPEICRAQSRILFLPMPNDFLHCFPIHP